MSQDPDVLTHFYDKLRKQSRLSSMDIPESKVFFVRRAISDATGVCYSLEHVTVSLYLEGELNPDKYFPEALPRWYVDRYLGGKMPDMNVLRDKLRVLYTERLERQILASAELEVSIASVGEDKTN